MGTGYADAVASSALSPRQPGALEAPMEALTRQIDRAQTMTARLCNVADRVFGQQPPQPAAPERSVKAIDPSHALGKMEGLSHTLDRVLGELFQQVERLEML